MNYFLTLVLLETSTSLIVDIFKDIGLNFELYFSCFKCNYVNCKSNYYIFCSENGRKLMTSIRDFKFRFLNETPSLFTVETLIL